MGWRSPISREALSGSLDSFQQFGIGATQNLSKIKSDQSQKAFQAAQATGRALDNTVQLGRSITGLFQQARVRRHALALLLTATAVFGARGTTSHTAAIALVSTSSGYGATALDPTTEADVVASLATKTALAVSGDASKVATALNSQVALATSDDQTLAKRTVVTTAGDATRGINHYSVQSGDTLSGIASQFGITTGTVKWANSLDDADSLKPGQDLVILPVSGLLYTVQSGDSVDTLASKYQANAAQILSYNNAEVKGLVPGQAIIIPDGVKAEAPKPAAAPAINGSSSSLAFLPRPFIGGANGYTWGQCTWYVKNRRPDVGSFWGNAANWGYSARSNGYLVDHNPTPGAVAWTTGMSWAGHVAVVESVSGGQVLISEMNGPGGPGVVTRRWTSLYDWSGFIH